MISNLANPRKKPVSAALRRFPSQPSRLPHILKWSRSESGLSLTATGLDHRPLLAPPYAAAANKAIYEGVAEQHGRAIAFTEEAPPPPQRRRRVFSLQNCWWYHVFFVRLRVACEQYHCSDNLVMI